MIDVDPADRDHDDDQALDHGIAQIAQIPEGQSAPMVAPAPWDPEDQIPTYRPAFANRSMAWHDVQIDLLAEVEVEPFMTAYLSQLWPRIAAGERRRLPSGWRRLVAKLARLVARTRSA